MLAIHQPQTGIADQNLVEVAVAVQVEVGVVADCCGMVIVIVIVIAEFVAERKATNNNEWD